MYDVVGFFHRLRLQEIFDSEISIIKKKGVMDHVTQNKTSCGAFCHRRR